MSISSFLLYSSKSKQELYQCTPLGFWGCSANILKQIEKYNVNISFDNMIKCISSITQCVENHFLDNKNDEKIHKKTFPHKETMAEILYDEIIWVNKKDQPYALLYPLNTYSKENKMVVNISPVYTMEEFYERYDEIVGEITDFQVFLEENIYNSNSLLSNKTKSRSLFFILVKNHLENRPHITVVKHATIGKLYEYKILLLHTNYGLLDTGTTFIREYSEEEDLIKSTISQYMYFDQLNETMQCISLENKI